MDMDSSEFTIDDSISNNNINIPTIYSWGRSDLHCLFYKEKNNSEMNDGIYSYRSNRNIISISSNVYHTCAVTSTGELYTCGSNFEGAISDLDEANDNNIDQLQRPKLFESLINHKIVSVACGLNHTIILTSSGIPISFGNNEVGQLGHSSRSIRNVKPHIVNFDYSKSNSPMIFRKISCGDLFSLFLTTAGELFGAGSGLYLGNQTTDHKTISVKIESLIGNNIVDVCCGSTFTLALDSTGLLFGFGNNNQSQLGISNNESSSHIQIPTIVPLSQIRGSICSIAAGSSHSIIWTNDGQVYGAGNNKQGQLGLNVMRALVFEQLTDLPYPCILASCGSNHSLLLCNDNGNNRVFGMGSNNFGNISSTNTSTIIRNITEIEVRTAWKLGNVYYIAAGGDQSFAVGVSDGGVSEASTLLKRNFSTRISKATVCMSTSSLHALLTDTLIQKESQMVFSTTMNLVTELFGSPSLLAGSFITDGILDICGLENVYTTLMQLGNSAIVRLFGSLMESLVQVEKLLESTKTFSESLIRVICIIWQSPLCSMPSLATDLFSRLIKLIMTAPFEWQEKLFATFLQPTYPQHIFVTRILKSLQENLSYEIDTSTGTLSYNTPYYCVCMNSLYKLFQNSFSTFLHLFYNETISSLSSQTLYADYKRYKDDLKTRKGNDKANFFSISRFPFLLSVDAKRRLIVAEANATQQMSAIQGIFSGETPYYIMVIRRNSILQDTLNYILALTSTNSIHILKKPLKIIFQGEEAIDEGGVSKEFFQLLISQLFDDSLGAFVHTTDHRSQWINKDKLYSDEEFFLIGIVLGLGLYNNILLDIHFPKVMYKKLLNQPVVLDDIISIDPELYEGFNKLLTYPNLNEIEYVFCRNFTVEWNHFDEKRTIELIPDGANIIVNGDNRKEYVDRLVEWILVDSVKSQFDSLCKGFYHFIDTQFQKLLRPEELELLLVGLPHLDFKELELSTEYIGPPYWTSSFPLIKGFWEIVHSMSFEEKQKLLKFVTGSTKAPVTGLKSLGFKIQREAESDNLPTSHTCFNILTLPEYSTITSLKQKLLIAIEECVGFGFI